MASGATGERSITEQGFQFLLLDTYGQLWLLLREYIASANERFGASNSMRARSHGQPQLLWYVQYLSMCALPPVHAASCLLPHKRR